MKKLLVALCIVLCMASSAFCIDPFKVNEGGFGPKIKGLQLGQKMSLWDIVAWRANFKGLPFILELKSENDPSVIDIKISDKGYEITNATEKFSEFQTQSLSLGDLLSKLEETGDLKVNTLVEIKAGREESEGLISYSNYSRGRMFFDEHDKDRRIVQLLFFVSDFGASSLTDEEFLQMFINAYPDIPSMSVKRDREGRTSAEYRNPSKGWLVSYSDFVVVKPIITQTSFD